jgi:hypothetical protein
MISCTCVIGRPYASAAMLKTTSCFIAAHRRSP